MQFDPYAQFSMKDHVALITGGAQNIGEAIARTFAAAGAKVMIADLNGEKAEATAKKIAAETGQQVLGIKCDVTNDDEVKACVAKTVEALGGLSTLINNVGWGQANPDPVAVSSDQMIASYKLNTLSAPHDRGVCAAPAEGEERLDHQLRVAGRHPAGVRPFSPTVRRRRPSTT